VLAGGGEDGNAAATFSKIVVITALGTIPVKSLMSLSEIVANQVQTAAHRRFRPVRACRC
jgi:hypothetical protein